MNDPSSRERADLAVTVGSARIKPPFPATSLVLTCGLILHLFTSANLLSAQQSDPQKIASDMFNATRQWLEGKLSTPGTSVKFREKERTSQDNRLKVVYNLVVDGAPKDQTYVLVAWPINSAKPVEQLKGLSIGTDGTVICAGKMPDQCVGEKENDPVNLPMFPAKGEIVRVALVSSDQKTKIFAAVVPDPITSSGSPCSVEVIRLMPQFALAFIRARGYAANENLTLYSKSYDESHQQDVKADSDGNAVWGMLPAVKGKQRGTTLVSAKSGGCTSSVSFDWGS
jgi:hypothetical protein